MELLGHLTRWIEQIGLMNNKINSFIITIKTKLTVEIEYYEEGRSRKIIAR